MPIPESREPNYIKATIISVIADIIYKIDPRLIKVEGKRVIGYKHLIPIEIPIITTKPIV